MDELKKYFDDFEIHARVMPVLVTSLPLIIVLLWNGIIADDCLESAIYLLIYMVALTFANKIARNLGKKCEKKMYEKLGGKPTTIVLRFSDDTFDEVTTKRYHEKLNQFAGLKLPLNSAQERKRDDQQYDSAINALRNYANDNRDKEPRVYQELKDYNFWRNLYGIKPFAVVFYGLLAIRCYFAIPIFSLQKMFLSPVPDYVEFLVMVIAISLFLVFVTQNVVKEKSFDYAKALVEVCERLP